MYSDSDDEGYDCPLCMEELDIADRNFRPCPCGYKICRFCWHHIRENLNGRCPACRREYSDQNAEFEPISADEIQRIRREKKEKERQQKDMETANRRHLANMRVVQKNLVYIIGLHPKLATEETIRSPDYFGQFGKIAKIVINKRQIAPTSHANGATSMQPSAAVYVTYVRKEDAGKAIHAVDGSVMAGRILRASYGTTKYCTYYLRNMTCPNPNCLYLHEPGEDADTISKEELATGKHRMRDQMSHDDSEGGEEDMDDDDYHYSSPSLSHSDFPPVSSSSNHHHHHHHQKKQSLDDDRPALPATASWGKTSTPGTPVIKNSTLPDRALTPDAFGPPLAVAVAQQQQQQQQQQPKQLSPSVLKRKLEKKKRKELLQKQRREEELLANNSHHTTTTNTTTANAAIASTTSSPKVEKEIVGHESTTTTTKDDEEEEEIALKYDSLVNFVLGDAFEEVCPPTKSKLIEEKPIGVTALYEGSSDEDLPMTPPSNIEYNMFKLTLSEDISPLEYLIQSTPSPPVYSGSFNPFSHQLLRSVTANSNSNTTNNTTTTINNNSNSNSNALFDSPVRKHSRFGFAQF